MSKIDNYLIICTQIIPVYQPKIRPIGFLAFYINYNDFCFRNRRKWKSKTKKKILLLIVKQDMSIPYCKPLKPELFYGTEVKALRQGKANLVDSYGNVEKGEVWLLSANISAYEQGNINNHEPTRPRKLLMNKRR